MCLEDIDGEGWTMLPMEVSSQPKLPDFMPLKDGPSSSNSKPVKNEPALIAQILKRFEAALQNLYIALIALE